MTTTINTYTPPTGQRVRVTAGMGLPFGYENAIGTVTGEYMTGRPYVLFDSMPRFTGSRPEGSEGAWVVSGWTVIRPFVGQKVIPLDPGTVAIPPEYHGKAGTVTEVEDSELEPWFVVTAEFPSHQKPDDTVSWSFRYWKPASEEDSNEIPATPVEPAIITDLNEQIETLRRELERANERVNEFSRRAGMWERDFDRYATRIMQEAVDRGWCSQYEEVVDDIRSDLEIAIIPDREVEVDISWEETYTVTVSRTGTVTLRSGYDDDDVERAARELNGASDADTSEILDAVRNGNYESEEYVDDSAQVE